MRSGGGERVRHRGAHYPGPHDHEPLTHHAPLCGQAGATLMAWMSLSGC